MAEDSGPNSVESSELTASLLVSLRSLADDGAGESSITEIQANECARLLADAWKPVATDDSETAFETGACESRTFDRFQVRRLCGKGGFAAVFEAFDPSLGRVVALKVPRPDVLVNPDLRSRFLRDAQAAAHLHHPNIVSIHEVGRVGPISFIVAAYVPGGDLAAWLKGNPSVTCRQAAWIGAALADAAAHAHLRGILHRDIKPSNVLLEPVPESESLGLGFRPFLTDFGLAKSMENDEGNTAAGTILGTAAYLSPEQAAGRIAELGVATDVYALGVILYELLVGHTPFVNTSTQRLLQSIRDDDPVPIRSLRPSIPRDLAAIVERCLEKPIERRYATAAELATDLQRYLDGRPVHARPVGAVSRAARWAVRRPLVASLWGAIALTSLVGIAGIIWQWREAESNRQMASLHADEADHQRQEAETQAALAQKHLIEAHAALNDLGVFALESSLWSNQNDSLRQQVAHRVEASFQRLNVAELSPELRATALTLEAQRFDPASDLDAAKAAYANAADAWKSLVKADPMRREWRRGYALCQFLQGAKLAQAGDLESSAQRFLDGQAEFEVVLASGDVDDRVIHEYANLLLELGNAYVRLGNKNAAPLYERSLAQFEQLASRNVDDPGLEFRVAQVQRMLGSRVLSNRDRERASELFHASLKSLESLVNRYPTNASYRVHLVETCRVLGDFLLESRDPECTAILKEGHDMAAAIMKAGPPTADDIARQATMARMLAMSYGRHGTPEQALDAMIEARSLYEQLDVRQPLSGRELERCAMLHYQLGTMAIDEDRLDVARPAFEKAVELFDRTTIAQRGNPRQKHALAHALLITGTEAKNSGDLKSAAARYQRAFDILEAMKRRAPSDPAVNDRLRTARARLSEVGVSATADGNPSRQNP